MSEPPFKQHFRPLPIFSFLGYVFVLLAIIAVVVGVVIMIAP